jgi:hypothetical protein
MILSGVPSVRAVILVYSWCPSSRCYTTTLWFLINNCDLLVCHAVVSLFVGIVLPISARLLVKNTDPFLAFLEQFPSTQILAWTGTGEPPISQRKIRAIQRHFSVDDQILGFDCNVASFAISGLAYDMGVEVYGAIKFLFATSKATTTTWISVITTLFIFVLVLRITKRPWILSKKRH